MQTATIDPTVLEKWDQEYIWHPFTQMQQYQQEKPLIIERGEGSYLYDIYGNKYLDGVSSLWVTVHGHCHPRINRAIIRQLEKVAHSTLLGLSNVPAILLAQRLVQMAPAGLSKVFYSDSGATAVEIAIKMAYQYWQQQGNEQYRHKKKFLCLQLAYHGDTIGAVSVGGIDTFHRIFAPLLFETITAPAPYCYRCPWQQEKSNCRRECLQELEKIIKKHQHELAAMIMEPLVQGAAGMIVSPPGYLRRARELCRQYNLLFIADEVATGFGRTGKMFACQHEEVSPDILCLAKGITGGYLPLAATLTTEEIFRAFLGRPEEGRTFYHGHTYTGNPLACAAALASLDLFEQSGLLQELPEKAAFLSGELAKFYSLPHVGDVRQKGLMVGIELVLDRTSKEPYPPGAQIGHRVILAARQKGLILRPLGHVIVLMPVLTMSIDELRQILEITYQSIAGVTGE
ncbi:adenosylmethionine--8-amino-7-oxononanoate transaminase [Desulfurispora thermophila]|uniref:adenosylmethionine--8-amino-7-oxononanoate transaminase n=1 Tax=Desulfurispora thermophila TaxID=265470 RepID=UPI0003606541|nr:adenosylmethionine--8-amino-7-oxononanoate transaminase [Desulfurispora thermophila]